MNNIESLLEENRIFTPSDAFKKASEVSDNALHKTALENRLKFWETQANQLHWFKQWDTPLKWESPNAQWFVNGKLNASYNCLDTHLQTEKKDKKAIIWEGELGATRTLTYSKLHAEVCKMANVLQSAFKIQKGDRVTIYLPMIPELAISVLACARIGAIHSVVFAGFSAKSLKDRIEDSQSSLIITADGGHRRGSQLNLKQIVDESIQDTPCVKSVLVIKHLNNDVITNPEKDVDYSSLKDKASSIHTCEEMDSEDPLFILYTSGTTGKPKGIIHTTGGYLTHAKYSTKVVFDLKDSDIYFCTADIGWITGHTYVVYGPLSNGATLLMYEGAPDYPDKNRFWELIEKHKVTIFYTAPTAIRACMKWGDEYPNRHNLSSLRVLGSVGEPINPEAWMWYYDIIGNKKCPIVDTWWQTETGGIMITTLPGLDDMKPGSAGKPLPGITAKILDQNGEEIMEGGGLLSITEPWPSMLRGIWGDSERFKDVYWNKFKTYFAGDGATIDSDGYYRILGRVDDVLNVAGHRIGTMEVESAIVEFPGIAEAAVIGVSDSVKGQAIVAFVIPKEGTTTSSQLEKEIVEFVSKEIGAIAKPKQIIFTPELPKTRSGKIMRRVLKAIANNEEAGDVTTLANPDIVETLKKQLK